MPNLIGQSLGRYHILEQLGEGGMAVVYKAFDTRLETEVAVKVIRTESLPQNTVLRALRRFEREAKALARLAHPNIIPIIDYGEHEAQPYLVMQYIPGGTLKDVLKSGAMNYQKATQLLLPIARGLDYAHRQNMIHRDVKPSNILITEDGEPMLTDFGVAKIIDNEATVDLTGTSMAVGTPDYMAPEQFQGKTDARSDIYGLGIVFYEAVTGRKPYQADTPAALIIKQATDPLPRPTEFVSNLPRSVEQILLKGLAKDPANRYQSMGEFVFALEKLAQGKSFAPAKAHRKRTEEKKTLQEKTPVSKSSFPMQYLWFILGGVATISILLGWLLRGGTAEVFPTKIPTLTYTPTKIFSPTSTNTPKVNTTPIVTNSPRATAIPALAIDLTWERPADGMTMHYIPAGEFEMGSNDGFSDEKPIHTVYLDAYWMDETEVTNGMFAKCVSAGECEPVSFYLSDSSYTNHPVVYVDWNDAQNYCRWTGGQLPTEAEWEKAARGGLEGKKYPWGNEKPFCHKSAENGAQFSDCSGDTKPVGSFRANGYGLYDMSGNVWEWVSDWYDSGYYASSPSSNPSGPSSGNSRVLHGCSWDCNYNSLRSANRLRVDPTYSRGGSGFRCSRREAAP
jgi:eukaryotic-like serine/threonine-protein kinase